MRIQVRDVPLPPGGLRTSRHHKADSDFLETGQREVRQLEEDAFLTGETRVLDIGCGPGRLAIALLDALGPMEYLGVDIIRGTIDWCRRNISARHPLMEFVHLDRHHRRYAGRGTRKAPIVPAPDGKADLVYLFSVVSHMERADLMGHLVEFERVLAPGGRIVLTGFIVDGDIPDCEENPPMPANGAASVRRWAGPLHCVRYRRDFFEFQLNAAGLDVDAEPIPDWDPTGQTRYVIRRDGDC